VIDRFYNLIAIQCSTASNKISLEKQMIKKFSSCYGSFATVLAIPLVPTGASWTNSTVLPFVVTLLPHICHTLLPSLPPLSVHLNNIQQTVQIKIPLIMPHPPVTSLYIQIFILALLFWNAPSLCPSLHLAPKVSHWFELRSKTKVCIF